MAMKRALGVLLFLLWSPWALAVAPYISADRVAAGDVAQVLAAVEKKTGAAGLTTLGKYQIQGMPQYAVLVVSDKGILDAIHRIGGSNIVGAGIRIGVQSDGTVSYMNPDYWYRAFFRNNFVREQAAVKAVQERLAQALGVGAGFGGDERAAFLPEYRYMPGMERFDSDKNELNTLPDFNAAVTTVRDNLAKGVNHTAEVYEVVMADKKIAVFGVAMNDDKTGDGRWVYTVGGADYIAGLPYEIYIVGNKVYSLYARYRIALGWPNLSMGHFTRIVEIPDEIRATMGRVAGTTPEH
ncbi:hypothetical protein SFMTTN_1860 [Sulfuriferula multivorans]|uniref:Uncharacterized protein n=1 Tax=Sulfuriferula multivorans TaxID=1559896 RepID=A0A401JEK4_9PROT|nr:hypothetical protein [Sulfuriferula multivorans]GBL46048.1 hypothetical protein SFMTTN_1860 [Sulfuriferula multivorans]